MRTIDFALVRSDRKSVAIQVKRDGTVVVRAPRRMTDGELERIVEQDRAWIERQLERMSSLPAPPPEPTPDELRELTELAKRTLPARVEYYSKIMGLTPTGITVTSAKSRYGSCSPKNRLCFSCRLMQRTAEEIDYVVVHELAHIRHKNHGREFHALVASILPDHKERRAKLRE